MFIARDSFLYSLSYELSKILFLKNGREPLGHKHFVPNGTFSDRLYTGRGMISNLIQALLACPWLLCAVASRPG
jgi:hypothetical protein